MRSYMHTLIQTFKHTLHYQYARASLAAATTIHAASAVQCTYNCTLTASQAYCKLSVLLLLVLTLLAALQVEPMVTRQSPQRVISTVAP